MYVRFNVDKHGLVHLQQLISLVEPTDDVVKPSWEDVPLVGGGSSQSPSGPILVTCGLFFIKEYKTVSIVSALSVEKIIEVNESRVRIDTNEKKKFFFLDISQYDFLKLMTKMLNKFMIVNVEESQIIEKGLL